MTAKEMRGQVRATGCTVRVRDGEIRVNVPGGNEDSAYYTNDREDAVRTAQAMADALPVKVCILAGKTFQGRTFFEEAAFDVSRNYARHLVEECGIARYA